MTNILNLFKFIESKRKQYHVPLKLILINNLPLPKDDLNVKGNLDLSNTQIKSLPNNLKINGSLSAADSPMPELPDNLTVKRHIYISNTPIKSLPNNLKVGKDLYLSNTPISKKYTKEEILKMIEDTGGSVGGEIYSYS